MSLSFINTHVWVFNRFSFEFTFDESSGKKVDRSHFNNIAMKTLTLIAALLMSACFVFAQNPIISHVKKEANAVAGLKYTSNDALYITEGFSKNADLKKLLDSTTTNDVTSVFKNLLFSASYRLGYRGVTSILRSEVKAAREKFNSDIANGASISTSKDTRSAEINSAYEKAIDTYSRVYEIHSSDGFMFIPARNRFLSRYYYSAETDRTVQALSNGSFSFNTAYNGGSLYTELVAGYLSFFRLSFGGMVAKSEMASLSAEEIKNMTNEELQKAIEDLQLENDKKLTIQNILAGGGNALVNAATPVLHYSSAKNDFIVVVSAFGRLGLALPEIGTSSDDAQVNSQYGLQLDLWHDLLPTSPERSFALFGKAMAGVFHNNSYAKDLGIHNGFRYVEFTGGIELNNRFRIAMNFPYIFGSSRPSEEGVDNVKSINKDLLKTTVEVTIIPFK